MPAEQFAIQNHPAAKSRAKKGANHVLWFAFQLHAMDAEGKQIAVVIDKNRHAQSPAQNGLNGHLIPMKIVGIEHAPLNHHAGHAQPDGANIGHAETLILH